MDKELVLERVEFDMPMPLQKWTHVWNSSTYDSSFLYFQNWIVLPITDMLGTNKERLILGVRRLLRPQKFIPNWPITHNWGDFYFHDNFTVMRVYGCPQPPHILPKIVPMRLAIIEFIWQLTLVDKEYLLPHRKCTFFCLGCG